MRWNEAEVRDLASLPPQWEGKLTYKAPKSGGGAFGKQEFKERWFRLRANCLFYWRLPTPSGPFGPQRPSLSQEPIGVLLLEQSRVQPEGYSPECVHAFSLTFGDDPPERKHLFLADNARHAHQWIEALKAARYEAMRERLIELQIKLRNRTGKDPLLGTGFESNPVYCSSQTLRLQVPNFAPEEPDADASPRPKPRKTKGAAKSTFQSHVVESWEKFSVANGGGGDLSNETSLAGSADPESPKNAARATFQSHVPEGSLIDFS